ncbi:MBL fold metallo-hydrolase [Amycolatopsis sp.]|uniref:MBL fold metallo-hydrolase n=1 Tax=Amycolatopsis sp. TaxID=37632 RepID=UPI002C0F7CEE|nr:MBL fold metallo-hydrolase [Amycolatopsis sp.]HVV12253.1 MBL fold metallo-hydrolase [Amycolatopsis sp.]
MPRVPYTRGLHPVAPDVWAWLAPDGGWGRSNAGLIAGPGSSLLVDTLFDLPQTREMLGQMAAVTTKRPLSAAVNTHGNGDHCFGNSLLPADAPIYAAPATAHRMHAESPELLAQLVAAFPDSYAAKAFSAYEFEGIRLRDPDVTVTGETVVELGERRIRIVPVAPAHTEGDVIVHVPDVATVFTGDLLFIEGAPIVWAGPIENWLGALDDILALEPEVVVPGHGPVTDADGIRDVQAYLRHVDSQAREAFRAGKTWREAAFGMDLDRFAKLRDSERVVINTHAVYRHLDPGLAAANVVELFQAMGEWLEARR